MAGGAVISRAGRARGVCAGIAMLAALVATGGGSPAAAGLAGAYQLEDLGNFSSPVHADDAPGYPDLLFVVEQEGEVRVLDDGVEQPEPFLDITDRVHCCGEQGLLSIAFHPNYETNRRFYVFYVNESSGHDLEVSQFKRHPKDELDAREGSERRAIVVQHNQADNHNGGQLQFGPDGYLYLAPGDGGPQGDPENDAQSKDSLLGKILRIRPLSDGGYTSPDGNPFKGKRGHNQIWARGLRNPYRFSFDAATGALTIGDVGGSLREEIDYEPDGGRKANFGWNDYEGFTETNFGTGRNARNHQEPIHDYPNAAGPDAVTGGYVIRDPGLPGLVGRYLYADFYDGDLRTLIPAEGGASDDAPLGLNAGNVSSFGEGAGGQIYVVDYGGDVFALEPAP